MLFLRTFGFCFSWILWIVLAMILAPILFLRREWTIFFAIKSFVVSILLVRIFCNIKIKIEGEEVIPKQKPFIVCSKHLSAFETFFFAYYFKAPVYILKRSLMLIPVFGWYLIRTGMIGINRKGGHSTRDQIKKGTHDVLERQKRILVIFPQGTRTPIDERYSLEKYPYKKGIAAIASDFPQIPILLATHNAVKCFGKGFFSIKKPGVITFKFIKTVTMEGRSSEDFLLEVAQQIEMETNKLL